MKKILLFLIISFPIMVYADVNQSTATKPWTNLADADAILAAKTECYAEEDKNNSTELASASTGWYLYCAEVSCTNNANVIKIANPLSSKIKCTNGNTDPYANVVSGSISSPNPSSELKSGAACAEDGVYAYATELVEYNCSEKSDKTAYTAPGSEQTPKEETKDAVTSPNTGVKDYYIALGSIVVLLSLVLYIINRKNLFKKI